MRRILLTVLALLPAIALAGFPFEATLEEIATSADHVLVGRVTGVDMISGSGRQVRDPEARTGPGLNNQIRLRIAVTRLLPQMPRRSRRYSTCHWLPTSITALAKSRLPMPKSPSND